MRPRYADLFQAFVDPDPTRADAAYDAVLFDRGEALPDLVELYQTSDDPLMRFYAIQLMGFSGDKKAIPHVLASLADRQPSVRAEACRALEDLRARDAVDDLAKHTRDPDSSVRRAAREAVAVLTRRTRS